MHRQPPRSRDRARAGVLPVIVAALAGCSGPQSALAPAGVEAEAIARLFWIMAAGAVLAWLAVCGLALWIGTRRRRRAGLRAARWLILLGAAVPVVVLGALLAYGLALMPRLRAPADAGPRIAVTGEQWWWRVRYLRPGAAPVELANEIRLPVGVRTRFLLDSPDVIHSLWIPALGGKVDMIPGRTNTLVLEPTRTGVFRGACAEFCGTSHAFMQLDVVVMEPGAFARWLEQQAAPARAPREASARQGRDAFLENGCGACHAIRGTPADGALGPDLTHVGSRLGLAAGTLPNDVQAFERWIAHAHAVKPDTPMPEFDMLPDARLRAIAAYLDDLQ